MKNLKLSKKFLLSFGIILLFFILTALTAVSSLNRAVKSYEYFYEKPFEVTSKVMDMRRDIQAVSTFIMYAMETDDVAMRNYITLAQSSLNSLNEGIQYLYECEIIDHASIDEFKALIQSSTPKKEKIFGLVLVLQNSAAIEVYFAEYYPILTKANDYLEKINTQMQVTAENEFTNTKKQIAQTFLILMLVSALTLAVTVFLAYNLTKSLAKPILELEHAANDFARGNFNTVITYTSKDELGSLSESMRTMTSTVKAIISDLDYAFTSFSEGDFTIESNVGHLYQNDFALIRSSINQLITRISTTLLQINQAADQVASGSEQVSGGAQALSHGATEQASSIEELSATIGEISHRIKDNAQNANHAKAESEMVAANILQSNQHMQEMIQAMNEITDKSNEIRKIIKTIDEIAFQTNILALNAAVEAARAGAAGKGFAVVADEVRNLAGKSAQAAKNTSQLIEEAIAAVKHGTESANETAASILGVVDQSKIFTKLVNEISAASNEQANAVGQVTMGVEQISSVVQTNSATAQQSAAASEELSGQALLLKQLVEKFKLVEVDLQSELLTLEQTTEAPEEYTQFDEDLAAYSKY